MKTLIIALLLTFSAVLNAQTKTIDDDVYYNYKTDAVKKDTVVKIVYVDKTNNNYYSEPYPVYTTPVYRPVYWNFGWGYGWNNYYYHTPHYYAPAYHWGGGNNCHRGGGYGRRR